MNDIITSLAPEFHLTLIPLFLAMLAGFAWAGERERTVHLEQALKDLESLYCKLHKAFKINQPVSLHKAKLHDEGALTYSGKALISKKYSNQTSSIQLN